MEKITATFRVVTPLFMSGADQTKAELRLASIKGALRFWWRALAWAEYQGDMKAIHQAESKLFGSADQEIGQAKVLMKLELVDDVKATSKPFNIKQYPGLIYLGYGVINYKGEVQRRIGEQDKTIQYIPHLRFQIHFLIKSQLPKKAKITFENAIKLLGLLGNIGAKARKGYGSLVLEKLTHHNHFQANNGNEAITEELPKTIQDLQDFLRKLRNFSYTNNVPQANYTALSAETRFLVIKSNDKSALSLLNRLGKEMMFYRSYGRIDQRNGERKVLGNISEENFPDDHDLMYAIAHQRNCIVQEYPERVAFGLPHNYFFSATGRQASVLAVDYTNQRNPTKIERRASPLFIHIHRIDNKFVAIISFIPSQYLPSNAKIRLDGASKSDVSVDVNNTPLWQPIHDFLERLKGQRQDEPFKRQENFGNVVEV